MVYVWIDACRSARILNSVLAETPLVFGSARRTQRWANLDRSPARDVANVRRSGDVVRRRRPVKESANLWRAEEVEKSRGFGEDGGKAASASDAAVRT